MRRNNIRSAKQLFAFLLAAVLVFTIIPVVSVYAENEVLSIGCNDQKIENISEITLGAGQTLTIEAANAAKYILTIREDNVIVTYDDLAYVSKNGEVSLFLPSGKQYIVFDVTNTSDQDRTIELVFHRFEGHMNNPVQLERIDDMTIQQLSAYEYGMDTGMYLQWTAPSDGTLILDATDVEAKFDGMTGYITVNDNQESVDGVLTRSVTAGELLEIRVVAFNTFNLPLDCLIHLKADFDGEQSVGEIPDMITPVAQNLTEGIDPADIPEKEPTSPPATEPPETQPVAPPVQDEPVNPFEDVKQGKFYYEPVLWAVEKNITTGTTPTTFAPDKKCTRGEVVTFLWRAQGSPEPRNTVNPFEDTNEDAFYYKAMLWAVEKGITNGISDTKFAPGRVCSRGEVATFLWRAVGSPETKNQNHPFTDVSESRFYFVPMLWAVENKVTEGVSATSFAPDKDCDRGQIVTFLYRALT